MRYRVVLLLAVACSSAARAPGTPEDAVTSCPVSVALEPGVVVTDRGAVRGDHVSGSGVRSVYYDVWDNPYR